MKDLFPNIRRLAAWLGLPARPVGSRCAKMIEAAVEEIKRLGICGVVMGLCLGFYACAATTSPKLEQPRWSCDPQVDATAEDGGWTQAVLGHQALLEADPHNCLAMYHLGYALGQLGDREKEIGWYEQAVACGYDQDDLLFFNLGMAYGEVDQVEKALAAFERAVALKPQNVDNYFGLGLTARLAGQMDLARQCLNHALALDPNHWDARIELARIYLDQGALEDARLQLEAVQKGDPDHGELEYLWHTYEDRKITTYLPGGK